MPRSSSTVRSYTPSTPGVIGELGIAWSSSGGHTHDGIESTLINGESYSVFDFRPVNRGTTNERSLIQDRNREALKAFIVETIKTDYIEFNNILIGPDVIGAQNIIAGSISSELIAANTIVANNIAANAITTELLATDAITSLNFDWNGSSTFSNSGTRLSLTDGQIIGKNIRVDASGNLSVSGSGTFTGTINASGGTFTDKMTAGLTEIGNNIRGASNYAGLALRNDSWENAWVKRSDNSVYFRAGSSTKYIQVDTTGTTTIQFPNFSVDNNGNISATNATVSGTINASSGTFSGTITASGTISGGTITGATITGSTLTTSGTRNVSISTNQITLNNAGGEASRIRFVPGTQSSYGVISSQNRLKFETDLGADTIEMGIHPTLGGISIISGGGNIVVRRGVTDGNQIVLESTYVDFNSQIRTINGSSSSPSYSFSGSTNTGIYYNGVNGILAHSGVDQLQWNNNAVAISVPGSTTNTTTWRVGLFNTVQVPSSSRDLKENIFDLEGLEAISIISRLRPKKFTWKPAEGDTEYVANLKRSSVQAGFVVEDIEETDLPFSLLEYSPNINEGMSKEEKIAAITDLASYKAIYWKEPHVISILTAAVKYLAEEVEYLKSTLNSLS